MLDWKTIQSSKRYQSMSPDEQAATKADYDSQVKTTPTPTVAPTTQTQTAATPKTSSAPSVSWDQIINSQRYKNMSDAEKIDLASQYEKSGGKAETASVVDQAIDFGKGLVNSAQSGIVHGFTGLVESADTGANKLTNAASNALGLGDVVNPNGSDVSKWAQEQRQQFSTAYEQRTAQLKNTAGGRAGLEYGETATDIGAMIAAPEVAIPYMVGKAFGKSYGDQTPDAQGNKSFTKAGTDAGITYALSKIPGGSSLTKTYLPEAKNALTKFAVGLIDTGEKSVIGGGISAGGGYASDMVHGLQEGKSLSEANDEALKNVSNNFITGAAFTGGSSLAGKAPTIAKSLYNGLINTNSNGGSSTSTGVHPDIQKINDKIKVEHQAVNDPNNTPEQKSEAWNQGTTLKANAGFKILDEHGYQIPTQASRGSVERQSILGTTDKEANSTFSNSTGEKAKVDKSISSINDSFKSADLSNKALVNTLKENLGNNAYETTLIDHAFTEYNNAIKQSALGNATEANKAAIKSQQYADKLPEDVKKIWREEFKSPKGFTEGFDPISHAHEYQSVLQVKNNIHDIINNTDESTGNLYGLTRKVLGFMTAGKSEIAAKPIDGISDIIRGANKAKQAARNKQAQLRASQINQPEIKTNFTPKGEDHDLQTIGARRYFEESIRKSKYMKSTLDNHPDLQLRVNSSTVENPEFVKNVNKIIKLRSQITDPNLAKQINLNTIANKSFVSSVQKLDTQRNKIVDPALRSKLTLNNINDDIHVSGIKSLDRAQNRDLADQKLEVKAAQNKTAREASDAVEQKALDEFRKGAGKDYSNKLFSQAITETTKGGKALSADRVINHLTKISDKASIPGSKEWFVNQVNKMPHVSEADKAGMIGEVNKHFANGNTDTATLSNQLGKWESKIHTNSNRESFAETATANATKRNEAIEAHNKAIVKANQVDETAKAMEKVFANTDVPEYKKSDFIRRHNNKVYSEGAKSSSEHATAIKEAIQAAKDYAQRVATGKPGEPDVSGTTGKGADIPENSAATWANKDFDQPIKVISHGTDGYSKVKQAIVDKDGKITGYVDKISYVPTNEIVASNSTPEQKPTSPKDNEPLPVEEVEHLQSHIVDTLGKSIKGKSVSDIQHEADLARERANAHLDNNPQALKEMITGINALERLSIRVAENPGKDIRDVIKQNDIMNIKVAQNSGVKGLIFHALTGKSWDSSRKFLYGEGESVASKSAEKAKATAEREGALRTGSKEPIKTNAQRFGVGKMPTKKLKVKPQKSSA